MQQAQAYHPISTFMRVRSAGQCSLSLSVLFSVLFGSALPSLRPGTYSTSDAVRHPLSENLEDIGTRQETEKKKTNPYRQGTAIPTAYTEERNGLFPPLRTRLFPLSHHSPKFGFTLKKNNTSLPPGEQIKTLLARRGGRTRRRMVRRQFQFFIICFLFALRRSC